MRTGISYIPTSRRGHYVALALFAAWLFILSVTFAMNVRTQYAHVQDMALMQAKALVDKDLIYRQWNAKLGGVWADKSRVAPNPHLKQMRPDRDRETADRGQLTLVDPTYMTRMVFAIQKGERAIESKITSLRPINPDNAPDTWEDTALRAAEGGRKESREIIEGDRPLLRYLRALVVENECLDCHARQDYKLGDVRGGISVTIPLQPLYATAAQTLREQGLNYLAIWLLGVVGLGFGYRSWRHHEAARMQAVETGDAETACEIVHSLKSTARSVGAMQLGDLCERLEHVGKAGDLTALRAQVDRSSTIMQTTARAIRIFCQAH